MVDADAFLRAVNSWNNMGATPSSGVSTNWAMVLHGAFPSKPAGYHTVAVACSIYASNGGSQTSCYEQLRVGRADFIEGTVDNGPQANTSNHYSRGRNGYGAAGTWIAGNDSAWGSATLFDGGTVLDSVQLNGAITGWISFTKAAAGVDSILAGNAYNFIVTWGSGAASVTALSARESSGTANDPRFWVIYGY
jgi:hypothetical protein